jgi:arylsulfatase A-like enzyme
VVKTPNLDRLASEGVIFNKHYCQAVPCGPSRASLFTGMYQMNHRSVNNGTPLDRHFTNLALECRKGGFEPTLFGYTDTSMDPRGLHPNDPDLKTYKNMLPGMIAGQKIDNSHQKEWIGWLKKRGYPKELNIDNIFLTEPGNIGIDRDSFTSAPTLYDKDHSDTAFLTDSLLEWFNTREEEDWFVHLSYLRPHPPYVAPEPYNTLYDPEKLSPALRAQSLEEEGSQHPLLPVLHESKMFPRKSFFGGSSSSPVAKASDEEFLQAKATYYGLMTEVDDQLGRIFEYLKATGQYESTLIVFTSDHGEQLGDHYMFGKMSYFDASYHIPLIIRPPYGASEQNEMVQQFTESVDVMPTILDCLELEVPDQCDGVSLVPFLKGETPQNWREEVHSEMDFRMIGSYQKMIEQRLGLLPDQCSLAIIRDDEYKYVHMTALPSLFFDLKRDPGEFKNRIEDPDYRELVLKYSGKMISWMMNHRDRVLANMNIAHGKLIHWHGPRN